MSGLPFTGFVVPSGGSGAGGAGDVVGPGSSTSGNLAEFGDTSGALLADSGIVADNVVTNAGASTDNALARYDTTTGKLVQDSALTVSDVAGGVVTLATTAGNALTIDVVEPAAAAGASVAGDPLVIQAGDAVASTDTAGAAAGGDLTLRAGDAARFTSGNAAGGNIIMDTGSGIGTGAAGQVQMPNGTAAAPSLAASAATSTGIAWGLVGGAGSVSIVASGTTMLTVRQNIIDIPSNGVQAFRLGASNDSGLTRYAASTLRVTDGQSGVGLLLHGVPVEANTAGSGSPNAITAAESGTLYTNEGTTAENYHTLPSAVAGYVFTFVVQDADGIRITAAAGDTIRPIAGTAASAAAGFIRCATQGAFITLCAVNATEWIAIGSAGVWTIDS